MAPEPGQTVAQIVQGGREFVRVGVGAGGGEPAPDGNGFLGRAAGLVAAVQLGQDGAEGVQRRGETG